jgi:hypothetical protein
MIIITTDHGRKAPDGKDHGGQSDRERETWIVTNAQNLNGYFKNEKPAMVDILPTIARFMEIDIPITSLRELDGVPMIGELSIGQVKAEIQEDVVILTWLPMESTGKVSISYAKMDEFGQDGTVDNYLKIGETELALAEFKIPFKDLPIGKLKFWIQGAKNGLGVWVLTGI